MEQRSDWVEIIEPHSRERMYVNLLTGECGWEPPPDVGVRKADEKQWWELFDPHSNRFYYYNAISQQTVWHRPENCDIVPLAQLQAMKQNSQLEVHGRVHREGRNTPVHDTLAQEIEDDKEAAKRREDSLESHKDWRRWQPAPGTKAAMLVKVPSLKHRPMSSTSSGQQDDPNTGTSQKPLSRSGIYVQPQQAEQIPVQIRTIFPKETKQSVEMRKSEDSGFCSVFTGDASYRTHLTVPAVASQPETPKYALPLPLYDEPSLDSPIYDEPPVEMDTEGVGGSRTMPHVSPSNNFQKPLQSTKLLPHPSITSNKHRRNPSATEYSPCGREYIKHMVNVDQSKQLTAPYETSEVSVKPQSGQLTSKESFKQCWRVLEASILKNTDSRQNSLQTQAYATVISQQDSGYSTGPSPSLRKRRGRKQGAIETRLGSVGSSSELNMLNDQLIAEMRAVVSRSAACKGSKTNLDADMVETRALPESSKVRFQSEPSKKYGSCGSRDDIRASDGSLYRAVVENKGNGPSDFSIQQDVVRQKRAYEKIDSLAKTLISQTSLVSSESTQTASQSGTLGTNSKNEEGQQPSIPVYQFPYNTIRKPLSENSMVDWASKNLNMHTQGIFRKRISIANMLSWNGGSIKKPMLITSSHVIKKEACEMFKLVQMYMGDRQTRTDRNHVALIAVTKCWSIQGLRDEIYIQLVRQTTDNVCYQSLTLGWELMAISLAFFSPSPKFQSYLEGYIYRHLDQLNDENIIQRMKELQDLKNKKNSKSRKKRKQNTEEEEALSVSTYAKYCYRKLKKVAVTGGKKGLKKPSIEEIEHARNAIHIPSMFGSSLEEIMLRQQDTFPDHRLPWVQTKLSQQVLALGGQRTEGIFRIPGDIDEVNALKLQVDQWQIPDNLEDPTIPASLLKLWYRELEEPLIPKQFYKQCVSNYENPDAAVAVVQLLPELNKLVLCYLIHFLQIFAQPVNVGTTKMDVNNLAMVMAPNCLRCQSDDPRVIFENTRKEMSFLRMLIVHLDTSFINRIL
ncbi:rho GTPase-activating protein 39 isoform X2 [Microcaecilia unicolor]|uniref:Rho GTPase-activating protein 39 n=1 Tax=Microcaecilia unicolor TaxID=1415580 RepID=A0A6P7YL04_9AMPH|nr:rho GTPase-activating protein 39-like isoform X2 [Microcaecilia unicolor]